MRTSTGARHRGGRSRGGPPLTPGRAWSPLLRSGLPAPSQPATSPAQALRRAASLIPLCCFPAWNHLVASVRQVVY